VIICVGEIQNPNDIKKDCVCVFSTFSVSFERDEQRVVNIFLMIRYDMIWYCILLFNDVALF